MCGSIKIVDETPLSFGQFIEYKPKRELEYGVTTDWRDLETPNLNLYLGKGYIELRLGIGPWSFFIGY